MFDELNPSDDFLDFIYEGTNINVPIDNNLIDVPISNSSQLENPIKADTLVEFINTLLEIIIQIGTPVLVIMIIWVGFKFVTAKGNATKLGEAKEALLWTMVGAAIVLGAFVISAAIENTVKLL